MKGILTDESGDIIIASGTVAIGEADVQIVDCVLRSSRGEWKEMPLLGANISAMLGGNLDDMWASDTRKQLEACGVKTEKISIDKDTITIY